MNGVANVHSKMPSAALTSGAPHENGANCFRLPSIRQAFQKPAIEFAPITSITDSVHLDSERCGKREPPGEAYEVLKKRSKTIERVFEDKPTWSKAILPYIQRYVARYTGDEGPSVVQTGDKIDLALERIIYAMKNDAAQGEANVRLLLDAVLEDFSLASNARFNGSYLPANGPTLCTSPTTPLPIVEQGHTNIPNFPKLLAAPSSIDPAQQSLPRPPVYVQPTENGVPLETLENIVGRRPTKSRKIKTYSKATASKHCHICARSAAFVQLVKCANLEHGTCRKTTCDKCFLEFGWDWAAVASGAQPWTCTHCVGNCPDRAQCAIYKRTNERRRASGHVVKSKNGTSQGTM